MNGKSFLDAPHRSHIGSHSNLPHRLSRSWVIFPESYLVWKLTRVFVLLLQEGPTNSESVTPEASASVLSSLFFLWFNPMMDLGYQKPLMDSDLHQLSREHDAEVVTDRVEIQWREELRRRDENIQYQPSLAKAFVRAYWREYLAGVLPRLLKVVGSFVAPFLLQRIIKFVEDPELTTLYGILLLAILFVRPASLSPSRRSPAH